MALRKLEVELSDKTVWTLHEPTAKESPSVMQAMRPVFDLQDEGGGEISVSDMMTAVMANQEATDALIGIVARLSNVDPEVIGDLGYGDYYALLGTALILCTPPDSAGGGPLVPKTKRSSRSTKAV